MLSEQLTLLQAVTLVCVCFFKPMICSILFFVKLYCMWDLNCSKMYSPNLVLKFVEFLKEFDCSFPLRCHTVTPVEASYKCGSESLTGPAL